MWVWVWVWVWMWVCSGETLQVDFSDGSKGYLEQTCHHPPITSFKLDGPQSQYEYW